MLTTLCFLLSRKSGPANPHWVLLLFCRCRNSPAHWTLQCQKIGCCRSQMATWTPQKPWYDEPKSQNMVERTFVQRKHTTAMSSTLTNFCSIGLHDGQPTPIRHTSKALPSSDQPTSERLPTFKILLEIVPCDCKTMAPTLISAINVPQGCHSLTEVTSTVRDLHIALMLHLPHGKVSKNFIARVQKSAFRVNTV